VRCVSCGHEELALPTVRWRKSVKGQKFVLCESCLDAPLRSYAWLVPGDFSVTARCDGCWCYLNPRELVTSRPGGGYKRDIIASGLCSDCVG